MFLLTVLATLTAAKLLTPEGMRPIRWIVPIMFLPGGVGNLYAGGSASDPDPSIPLISLAIEAAPIIGTAFAM